MTIVNAWAATVQLGPVKMDARLAAVTRVVDVSTLCVSVYFHGHLNFTLELHAAFLTSILL